MGIVTWLAGSALHLAFFLAALYLSNTFWANHKQLVDKVDDSSLLNFSVWRAFSAITAIGYLAGPIVFGFGLFWSLLPAIVFPAGYLLYHDSEGRNYAAILKAGFTRANGLVRNRISKGVTEVQNAEAQEQE